MQVDTQRKNIKLATEIEHFFKTASTNITTGGRWNTLGKIKDSFWKKNK